MNRYEIVDLFPKSSLENEGVVSPILEEVEPKQGGDTELQPGQEVVAEEDLRDRILEEIPAKKLEKRREEALRAVLNFLEAKAADQAESQSVKLNGKWLKDNGFNGLRQWAKKSGLELSDLLPDEYKEAWEGRSSRTWEGNQAEALEALNLYKEQCAALPEGVAAPVFNMVWLENNGFKPLTSWLYREKVDFASLLPEGEVALWNIRQVASPQARTPERNQAEALEALTLYKQQCAALPEGENAPVFNGQWLNNNGYGGVLNDCYSKKTNFEDLLPAEDRHLWAKRDAPPPRTLERNQAEALEALALYKEQCAALGEEDEVPTFNTVWLKANGFAALSQWVTNNKKDFTDFLPEPDKNLWGALQLRTDERNKQEALSALAAYKAQCLTLQEGKPAPTFNMEWLEKNGFTPLFSWLIRANADLAILLPEEDRHLWKRRKIKRITAERVGEEALEAVACYKDQCIGLPEEERPEFNVKWLEDNGYASLSRRLYKLKQTFYDYIPEGDKHLWTGPTERNATKDQVKSLQEFISTQEKITNVQESDFLSLIAILGPAASADILYTLHPEYKGLPMREVGSILSRFIGYYQRGNGGDYRPSEPGGNGGYSVVERYLDREEIHARVLEVMKAECLRVFSQERGAIEHDEEDIMMNLIVETLRARIRELPGENSLLLGVVQEVGDYYSSLATYFENKPEYVVGSLREGRPFPDLFQRINIKELEEKKRILIADETGVGKSASVILAKEVLGIKSALIVAPSNVIETWRGYLSPGEGGYFTKETIGEDAIQLPSVLVVNSVDDARQIEQGSYDYVLVSQERLTEAYMPYLESLNADMLVVDEMHKLKNMQGGKRAKILQKLAAQAEEKEAYLALLSATPVPNKLRDIAILLKLLHPEKYAEYTAQELESYILKGDFLDLRAELTTRMQRKKLTGIQTMPELYAGEEQIVRYDLNEIERAVYEFLLEEDDAIAAEKIRMLRTFLLNGRIDGYPLGQEAPPAKVRILRERIENALQHRNKIIVFVNGYIDGVIRGDSSIQEKLDLNPDIRINVIDGQTPKNIREEISRREKNDLTTQSVTFVSGQTADVGKDYSWGGHIILTNEPWTVDDIRQEVGRVYRPGLENSLTVERLITNESIEEGIHEYILMKDRIIAKFIDGEPISELERSFIAKADQIDKNLEENAEQAEEYLRGNEELRRMFSALKEQGERKMQTFVKNYGFDYAKFYSQSSARSYEANANRFTGALIKQLIKKDGKSRDSVLVADIGAGPEMLRQHGPDSIQSHIISFDINSEQLVRGPSPYKAGASMLAVPLANGSAHYALLNFGLHYTQYKTKEGNFERFEALKEAIRVVEVGGSVILNLLHTDTFKDDELFSQLVEALGCELNEEASGEVVSGENYRSHLYVLKKVREPEEVSASLMPALKLRINKKSRLKDARKVLEEFEVNNKRGESIKLKVQLNSEDMNLKIEEEEMLTKAENLVSQFGSTSAIPANELVAQGYSRYISGEKVHLFKKLASGKGYVLYKDKASSQRRGEAGVAVGN